MTETNCFSVQAKAKEKKQKSIDKIPHGASEILYDFLYLGSGRDANDKQQLRELGITRVLNVAREWRMPDSDDEDEGFDVKDTQLEHVIDAQAEGNNNNAVNQAIKEDEALFEKKDAQSNSPSLDNDGHLHQKLEELTLVKQGEKIVYKKLHLVDVVDEDVTSIFNEAFDFLGTLNALMRIFDANTPQSNVARLVVECWSTASLASPDLPPL